MEPQAPTHDQIEEFWLACVREEHEVQRRVEAKLAKHHAKAAQEVEARRRIELGHVSEWARSIRDADFQLTLAGISRERAVELLAWAPQSVLREMKT